MADGNWKRWRGGTGENTLRDDVALRGGERERGRRRIGGGTGDRRSGGGSASSAISYPSMVHGMPVHGAVMHIMGGMCTCRRSQLFDTAAARYTCRRYLSHASRMGLRLTPSFPTRFRLPPCPPFVRLLLIDNLAGSRTKWSAEGWSIAVHRKRREKERRVFWLRLFSSCGVRFLLHRTRIPCIIYEEENF